MIDYKNILIIILFTVLINIFLFKLYNYSYYYYDYTHRDQCYNIKLSDMKYNINQYGTSMLPTISEHSILFYTEYNSSLFLNKGDIVIVKLKDDIFRMHRIVDLYPDYFTMKGDNNKFIDNDRYKYNDIYGVICGIVNSNVKL